MLFLILLNGLFAPTFGRMLIVAGGNYADENGIFSTYYNEIQKLALMLNKQINSIKINEIAAKLDGRGKMTTKVPKVKTTTKMMTTTIPPKRANLNVMDKEKLRQNFYSKVQNVQIQDEHAIGLYQHWADQAFSNIFALIANEKLKQFKKPIHDEFGECSKKAKTVPLHAKCVSDLLNGKFNGQKFYEKANEKSTRFDKYRMNKRKEYRRKIERINEKMDENNWVGSFRMMWDSPLPQSNFTQKISIKPIVQIRKLYKEHRRERRHSGIAKKNYYELLTPSQGKLSPLGKMAQDLMKKVLKIKGKSEKQIIPWQKTVERIQQSEKKRKAIKKELEEGEVSSMDQLTYRGMKRQGLIGEDLHELMENPEKLKKFLNKKRREKAKEPIQRFVNLLRDGIKLGYAFAGKNVSEMDNKTIRMVSPRFLSITPEDDPERNEMIDFLSPSLFSIHNEGKGVENLTSIPSIFKNIGGPMGFNAQDQQMWLDFIMEASNVIEDAELIEKEFNNTNISAGDEPLKTIWSKHFDKEKYEHETRTKDGTPLYFTKQNVSDAFAESETEKIDLFETIHKKIDKNQIRDMNKTGFALLSKEQLEMLYDKESPFADEEALKRFITLDKAKMLEYIEKDIHTLAEIKSFKITRKEPNGIALSGNRTKRQVILSPIVFTSFIGQFLQFSPIILSPIIFTPIILSPAIFGPVILSPWAFVPLVLSPRLLSPLVLSPVVFAPIILSPLAIHPAILTPGAFVPFVLSPLVLSPFILSPQVFTPLILSPLALSPFILNPAAASPFVLSPYVLSPIIFSPQFLSALVLSPYALSPVIQSPLIAFSVILSPSYLS